MSELFKYIILILLRRVEAKQFEFDRMAKYVPTRINTSIHASGGISTLIEVSRVGSVKLSFFECVRSKWLFYWDFFRMQRMWTSARKNEYIYERFKRWKSFVRIKEEKKKEWRNSNKLAPCVSFLFSFFFLFLWKFRSFRFFSQWIMQAKVRFLVFKIT